MKVKIVFGKVFSKYLVKYWNIKKIPTNKSHNDQEMTWLKEEIYIYTYIYICVLLVYKGIY